MDVTDNFEKHTSKNPLQRFLIANYYRALLKITSRIKIETVLDAGCGEGFTLARLSKANDALKLEGIDNSLAALTLGKKLYPGLNLKLGDINRLPYADESFDLVISSEVLEHLVQPAIVLKEIARVSKKYCLLSVPNEPWFSLANFLRGKNLRRLGSDIGHLNHWSGRAFKKFIETNGWRILVIKKPFPWIMVLGEKKS